MNILEVCHLDVASFGRWDDPGVPEGDVVAGRGRSGRGTGRSSGARLTGAMIVGRVDDVWTVGMLKGLVQSGVPLGAWKEYLRRSNPFDVKRVRRVADDGPAAPRDHPRAALAAAGHRVGE